LQAIEDAIDHLFEFNVIDGITGSYDISHTSKHDIDKNTILSNNATNNNNKKSIETTSNKRKASLSTIETINTSLRNYYEKPVYISMSQLRYSIQQYINSSNVIEIDSDSSISNEPIMKDNDNYK
jgi:hypothetical protein